MKKQNYIVPDIEVFDVVVEKGFAATGDDPMEGVIKKPELDW